MKLLTCLISIIALTSCLKDKTPLASLSPQPDLAINPPDTLISDNWLMAFPGSYWVYDDGFSDTVSPYFLDTSCSTYYPADTGYIVKYRNSKLYTTYSHADYCYRKHFTFAAAGESSYQASNTYGTRMNCISIDTSMAVSGVFYDSVQVVHEYVLNFMGPVPPALQEINYYQYGVGCIRTIHYNHYTGALVWERNLIDHYIAPH